MLAGRGLRVRESAESMSVLRSWCVCFAVAALAALAALTTLAACSSGDKPDNLGALQDIQSHRSGDEVTVEGTVAQVLPTTSSPEGRHERFVLDVHTGSGDEQLILVAHNVDIAPPAPLQPGDDVIVRGQLELDRGGPVIHYTHHDPKARHQPGFIKVHGQTYD
jgi:hypothetical protein